MRINFEHRRNKFLIVSYEFIGRCFGEEKFLKNRGRILVMDLVSVFLIIFELSCGPIFI